MGTARTSGERGVVTAEMAVAMLAGVILFAAAIWALGLGVTQVRAMDAAAQVARQEARGVHDAGAEVLAHDPGSHVYVSRSGGKVTVAVELPTPGFGWLLPSRQMRAEATAALEPGEGS